MQSILKAGLRKPFILFEFWRKILYDVDTIVLTFFIYSVLGWICEVVYCSVPKKHFVNRGFLFGPYLPIYGFGATFVIVLLEPFYDSWPMVMILSAVITSVLEYITSFLLEKIFKVKLWDYSTYPLNLNGRICALNSTLFALLSLFIIYVINTPIYSFLSSLNPTLVQLLSLLVTAVMSADAAVAVNKMSQFQHAMKEIAKARSEAEEKLKMIKSSLSGENLAAALDHLRKETEERKIAYYRGVRHFFKSNPSLTVKKAEFIKQFELARETYEAMAKQVRDEYLREKEMRKGKRKDKNND